MKKRWSLLIKKIPHRQFVARLARFKEIENIHSITFIVLIILISVIFHFPNSYCFSLQLTRVRFSIKTRNNTHQRHEYKYDIGEIRTRSLFCFSKIWLYDRATRTLSVAVNVVRNGIGNPGSNPRQSSLGFNSS